VSRIIKNIFWAVESGIEATGVAKENKIKSGKYA
jgi:hypothetical protein